MIEILCTSPALSLPQKKRLLSRCRRVATSVKEIYAEYMYLAELSQPLDYIERDQLQRLLQYGPTLAKQQTNGRFILITPRIGTISPWSTKATNIAHNCGIRQVRRLERVLAYYVQAPLLPEEEWQKITAQLHDRMLEKCFSDLNKTDILAAAQALFARYAPQPFQEIDIQREGIQALEAFNQKWGLALSQDEIRYFYRIFSSPEYKGLNRNPTDTELYMFAQANSEHCRHKIFNATWVIDGEKQPRTLFQMIKNTFHQINDYVLSAYKDNAAVMEGSEAGRFFPDPKNALYAFHHESTPILMKVETHNHPTAIAPWPGAATGAGGEIRDEGATGRGAKPKAGLTGFSVSHLRIPGFEQPWEGDFGKPDHIASALEIMTEGPLGSAAYNNEFGRAVLNGYFRTYEERLKTRDGFELRGYHKPIMLAGGIGNIRPGDVKKGVIKTGDKLVVLGGPAMNIGLGGGAASSLTAGQSSKALDFASVQRDNAEMERRCQAVIDSCWQLGEENPISFIHDVGAGGLSNALPELIHDGGCGGHIQLRAIPSDEPGMTPLAIWCNESQERYVLAVAADKLSVFERLCKRERTPYAIVGESLDGETEEGPTLTLSDSEFNNKPVNMPLDVLLGNTPLMIRHVERLVRAPEAWLTASISLGEAVQRVLRLPAVAEKTFLVTIGDRSVGGMVARDQCVGPWQVPVADCAVTTASFDSYYGEAFSIGERAPVALLDAKASARLAVGEALTNLAGVRIGELKRVKLSANWMVSAGHPGEDAALYDAVKALGEELCPLLGLTIPVGKDSMSMKTSWCQEGEKREMVAPLSLIISAFARVEDVRQTVTPQLQSDQDNLLLLIDLGRGENALGATALAQVYRQLGDRPPDIRDAQQLSAFFNAIQCLVAEEKLLAYHDRSDGGLFVTLAEMAFAGHCGLDIDLSALAGDPLSILFNEELGAVIQISQKNRQDVDQILASHGLSDVVHYIGCASPGDRVLIKANAVEKCEIYNESRTRLRTWWAETTWQMQRLRDNPVCADQEHEMKQRNDDPGLHAHLTFSPEDDIAAFFIGTGCRPKAAILREQGTNSHVEMAAALDRAGFDAIDVHMTDLLVHRRDLDAFQLLAVCGGFSYGDVLGAGEGWAKSILFNSHLRDMFKTFLQHPDKITLGVCNGCQMLSTLRELIPGAEHWPRFVANESERFEARLSLVEVTSSPSLLLKDMEGSRLPIVVSHGEGRIELPPSACLTELEAKKLVALRFVDNWGRVTESYPSNPNGSAGGITAVTNEDGRVTLMMPHPERLFRTVTHSWHPPTWGEDGPWLRLFRNGRRQLG